MRTYSHGIIGYLIYIKGTAEQRKLAVLGAMVPDLFLSIGFIFHFLGNSNAVTFLHNLFHHSFLHTITEYMHSILIALLLIGLSYIFFRKYLPFFIGMLSHTIVDLLTHQSSLYNHFLPLPLPMFPGPFSYMSLSFTIIEHLFVLGFFFWFFTKKKIKYERHYKNLKRKLFFFIN